MGRSQEVYGRTFGRCERLWPAESGEVRMCSGDGISMTSVASLVLYDYHLIIGEGGPASSNEFLECQLKQLEKVV
jgi:hypothetical protein